MSNNLNNWVATTQPYNTAPWNYAGTETLSTSHPNIVDWVLIELRDSNDPTIVLAQQAALLLLDGNIVSTDWLGDNNLIYTKWYNLSGNDSYYIVVQHRNHLAIISQAPQAIPGTNLIDFSNPNLVMDGIEQLKDMGDGYYALRSGDFNGDGVITVADFNAYRNETAEINQYLYGDFNLDGHVSVADFNLYQVNASIIGVYYIRY